MRNHFDVIVVGGGVMGAATAYQLSKRNVSVLLIEQFQIGNIKGSSHGPSRIIRLAYDGVDYGRMAQSAYKQWRELETESNQELMKVTGGFDFGPPHATYLDGIRQTYLALNIPFEDIRGDEIIRRFPQINIPSDSVVLYPTTPFWLRIVVSLRLRKSPNVSAQRFTKTKPRNSFTPAQTASKSSRSATHTPPIV
jgi:glycine/D-amino acid oxidase-like deaminating enzyme